jgi:hypothetical protein
MYSKLVVLLAVITAACCTSNANLALKYSFNVTLIPNEYWLYWNFNQTTQSISLAVRVKTNGWIGFGLSPNGQMPGSDVIIGWIDDGVTYFHDRYAEGRYAPTIDQMQNWFLTRSDQSEGYTVMEFYRSYQTCDNYDLGVLHETAHVIFSYNDQTPTTTTNADGTKHFHINQHTKQGSMHVNLLGGLSNYPSTYNNTKTFTVNVHNARLSDDDTMYWCEAMRLPMETEKYIVKFSPIITAGKEQHVHHMLIYICNGLEDSDIGPQSGGNCLDGSVSNRITACARQMLLAAWSVGGSDFIYPENVAFPIGGPNNPQFAVIEIHYNNPGRISGIIDNSGITFTYVDNKREHNAGILYIGHDVDYKMILPPNTPNFTVTSICSDTCTKKIFPSGGIHIFANMLHTHLTGTGLILRHFKKTDCSGTTKYEELEPIEKNFHYDFNFQQINHLPREITVLPGDVLMLNCRYNTTGRARVTMGGLSTQDEMCLSFPMYYPRIDTENCFSSPTFNLFNDFIEKHVPNEYQQTFRDIKPDRTAQSPLEDAMNLLNWTSDQIDGFQKIIYSTGDHDNFCPLVCYKEE